MFGALVLNLVKKGKTNLKDYVETKKVSLTKIINKKNLLMFLVDFKVINAIYVSFVTLCMLIFDFF